MSRVALLGAAVLASCGVELRVPSGAEIVCTATSACPDGFDCNVEVGRCVSLSDAEPLQVLSIAPATSFRVVVVFNKPLTDAALEPSIYTIDPGIAVEAVELIDANHTVILHTGRQKSRPYDLRITGLVDAFGYVIADEHTVARFTGLGDPIDPVPLETTSPVDRAYLTTTSVELQWTPSRDAERYYVVVALDAAMQERHPDTPAEGYFTSVTPSLIVSVATDNAYFWQVTSDVSESYSNVARYSSVSSEVYVHCPSAEDCNSGPVGLQWEAGTRGQPFWSVSRAADIANSRGAATLHIAGRGGDAHYGETIAITSGTFDILGGWDPAFSTRAPASFPTILGGGLRGLQVIGVQDDLLIDGITIRSETDGTALLLANCGSGVVVRDCDLEASGLGEGNALVVDSSRAIGPVVEDSRFLGRTIVRGSAHPTLRRNHMRSATAPTVMLTGMTAGSIIESIIETGGIQLAREGTECPMTTIARNRVVGHDTSPALAANLRCAPSTRIMVANNVFELLRTDPADTRELVVISLSSDEAYVLRDPIFSFAHNTVVGGGDNGVTQLVSMRSSAGLATNNLFVCEGSGRTEGLFLQGTQYNFLSFIGNAFVGCTAPINYNDLIDFTTTADINGLDRPMGEPRYAYRGNHVVELAIADVFLGADDYHLALTPSAGNLRTQQLLIATGGASTSANVCGLHGASTSCGYIVDDRDGHARTPSASIGAYEREP